VEIEVEELYGWMSPPLRDSQSLLFDSDCRFFSAAVAGELAKLELLSSSESTYNIII